MNLGVAEGKRPKRMVLGTPKPGSWEEQRRKRPQIRVRTIIACLGREYAPITSPDYKKSDFLSTSLVLETFPGWSFIFTT